MPMSERQPLNIARLDPNHSVNAQQFLGAALNANPKALDSLKPRDQHIVLAHSDTVMPSSYDELGFAFNIATSTARKTYVRKIINLWELASPDIQRQYPLTEILANQGEKPYSAKRIEDAAYRRNPAFVMPGSRKFITSLRDFLHLYETDPEFRKSAELRVKENVERFRHGLPGIPMEMPPKTDPAKLKTNTDEGMLVVKRKPRRPHASTDKQPAPAGQPIYTEPSQKPIAHRKYPINQEHLELWIFAIQEKLIDRIREKALMTPEEISSLEQYFTQGIRSKGINSLRDKLYLLVAQLM